MWIQRRQRGFVHALLQRRAAWYSKKVVRFFALGLSQVLGFGWPILILFSVLVDAGEREEIFRVWFDGAGEVGGVLGRAEARAWVLEVICEGILCHAWREEEDGMRRFTCFRGSVDERRSLARDVVSRGLRDVGGREIVE